MVLDPIVFVSNKYRSVHEALTIIADDQKKKQKRQPTRHPMHMPTYRTRSPNAK